MEHIIADQLAILADQFSVGEYDLSYAVLMFRDQSGEGRIFRLEEGWPVGIITDMIPIDTTQGLFDLFDVLLSAPVEENTGFNILRNDGNRLLDQATA